MAFREKTLWVSLAATLFVWGWYFADFARALASGHVDVAAATGGFVRAVILLVAIQVVTTIVLAILSPREANAPTDAREREFAAAAARPAYALLSFLLVLMMLATPVLVPTGAAWLGGNPATVGAMLVANAILLALVLAECVNAGGQIVRYRRGG